MRKVSVEQTVRRELRSLRAQKEKVDRRIQILERLYAELRGAEAVMLDRAKSVLVPNGSPRPLKAGTNRAVIVSILESNEKPMAVRDIANKAFQNGQIRSSHGYKGVYNIVQTVLKRNKNTFIKVAPGAWDLRIRRSVKRMPKLA